MKLFTKRTEHIFLFGPTQLIIICVVIFPLIWAIYISLTNYSPVISPEKKFVGLANFIRVFKDDRFIDSLWRMVFYSGFGVAIQVLLGTALALAFVKYIKSGLWRAVLIIIYLLPMMMAEVVAAQMWYLLVSAAGTFNNILISLRFQPINWLGKDMALATVMIADIWQWTGLTLLIVFAARISVPEDLYESAELDGASEWMILRRITLPYLARPMAIAALLRFMDSYKYLDKVFIMTYGGPGTATELPTFYAYLVGFSYFKVGYAAAMSWIFGIGAVLAMLLFWQLMRGKQRGVIR